MNKKRVIILTLGLFATAIISCKKNGNEFTFMIPEGTYQNANSETIEPAVMYVSKKQIRDTDIINTYLRAHNLADYYVTPGIYPVNGYFIEFSFRGGDSVKFNFGETPTPETHTGKIIKYSNLDYFIQDNRARRIPFPFYVHRLDKIISKIPDSSYTIAIPTVPSTLDHFSFRRIPFQVFEGKLYLKGMMFTFTTLDDSCAFAGYKENIPVDHIEDKLLTGDTVFIQTRSMLLNKIP